jgi:hypothetical protein
LLRKMLPHGTTYWEAPWTSDKPAQWTRCTCRMWRERWIIYNTELIGVGLPVRNTNWQGTMQTTQRHFPRGIPPTERNSELSKWHAVCSKEQKRQGVIAPVVKCLCVCVGQLFQSVSYKEQFWRQCEMQFFVSFSY